MSYRTNKKDILRLAEDLRQVNILLEVGHDDILVDSL